METEIGQVIHYYSKAKAAVIKLNDNLKIGNIIKFVHKDDEFIQKVDSMQIEHESIASAEAGDEVAIKVQQKVHEKTKIFKIEE